MEIAHERGSTLPAAAERFVELNDAQQFVQLDLPEVQLCLQQIPVGVECIELGVDASLISHVRQSFPLLKDANKSLLLHPGLLRPLMSNQRIGDFGEGCLNCFP